MSVYRKGEDLFLNGNEAQIAISEQANAMESDDREGLVREYLEKLLPDNWNSMDLYERRNFLSGGDFDKASSDSYEITAMIARIENWKPYDGTKSGTTRFQIYNKQRAFMRVK